jgi:hypothetical protein
MTAAAAVFLFIAEPLAAIIAIGFSGFTFVCGSGGDPNSCPSHSPSAAAQYLLIAVLAAATAVGLALIIRWCLGPYGAILGWPLTIASSVALVFVPPLAVLLTANVDRTQHVTGRLSAEIPITAAVVFGLVWVGCVRWLTNHRAGALPAHD